jgi:hypothetical protein
MPITIPCICGKTLRVADEHAGKRVKCPACQAIATAPVAKPEPVMEVVETVAPPPRPTVPLANPRAEFEEYDGTTYGLAGSSSKPGEADEDNGPRDKPLPDFRLGSGRRVKKRNRNR